MSKKIYVLVHYKNIHIMLDKIVPLHVNDINNKILTFSNEREICFY